MSQIVLAEKEALALLHASQPDAIESIEAQLLHLPQVECPLTHHFAPGTYMREIEMPAGSLIIGHEHKTEHSNIVISGRALVMIDGKPFLLEAPAVFTSLPGVRKVLIILETMRFLTIHPNPDNETDQEKLAERFIVKSPSFLHYHEDIAKLREYADQYDLLRPLPALP